MPTKSAAMALLLGLASILTGCTATGSGATRAALCDQFQPVRWSMHDTDETIRQVKELNAVGKKLCGWRP